MSDNKLLQRLKQFRIHFSNFALKRVVTAIQETNSVINGLSYLRKKIAPKNVHNDLQQAEEKVANALNLLKEAKAIIDDIDQRAEKRVTELKD